MLAHKVVADLVHENLRCLFFSRVIFKLFHSPSILEVAANIVAHENLAIFQAVSSCFRLIRVDVELVLDNDFLAPKRLCSLLTMKLIWMLTLLWPIMMTICWAG